MDEAAVVQNEARAAHDVAPTSLDEGEAGLWCIGAHDCVPPEPGALSGGWMDETVVVAREKG